MTNNQQLIEKVARAILTQNECTAFMFNTPQKQAEMLAQAAITAIQSEQAGVNEELLEALNFYYGCADENYPVWIRKMQNDCGAVAKQAISNAEKLKENV